jgi:hypothetical protein
MDLGIKGRRAIVTGGSSGIALIPAKAGTRNPYSAARDYGFRVRGLRPRPGMTTRNFIPACATTR